MPPRHHPNIRWQVDWAGDESYGHLLSDVTSRAQQWVVNCGTGLSQFGAGIAFEGSYGTLILDNADGAFNPVGGMVTSDLLLGPRLAQLTIDGTPAWQGRATLQASALAEDPRNARFELSSRAEQLFRSLLRVNSLGSARFLRDLLDTVVREAAFANPEATFNPLDTMEVTRIVGPVWYEGSWPEFLDLCGNLAGGWFIETSEGTVVFRALENALSTAPAADFDTTFEVADRHQGGALLDTVANYAIYESRQVLTDRAEVVLAAQEVPLGAGQTQRVFYEFSANPDIRAIEWPRRPVQVSPAATVSNVTVSDEFIACDITAGAAATYEVRFLGQRRTAGPGYRIIDGGTAIERAHAASVSNYRLRELVLPPWQTTQFQAAQVRQQREFLRRRYRPMRLVLAEWDEAQVASTQTAALRDHATPGSVVQILRDRTLVMSMRLQGGAGLVSTRLIRGVSLNEVPGFGGIPDLGVPAVVAPVVPDIPRPDGPTMPGLGPVEPPGPAPVTDVFEDAVTAILGEAPGALGCSIAGDVVSLTWQRPGDQPSLIGGIFERDTTTSTGIFDDQWADAGNVSRDPLNYRWGTRLRPIGRSCATGENLTEASRDSAMRCEPSQFNDLKCPQLPSSVRLGWAATPLGALRAAELATPTDTWAGVTSDGQGTPAADRDVDYWWGSGMVLPSAAADREWLAVLGGGASPGYTTRLQLARSGTISGPGVPNGTQVLLESNVLGFGTMRRIFNENVVVRNVRFRIGRRLGEEIRDGMRRVFFAGTIPSDLDCGDFDLTFGATPEGGPPTITLTVSPDVGAPAAQRTLTWATTNTVAVQLFGESRPASGSVTFNPVSTQLVRATAIGVDGSRAGAEVEVVVGPSRDTPSLGLDLEIYRGAYGERLNLDVTVANATRLLVAADIARWPDLNADETITTEARVEQFTHEWGRPAEFRSLTVTAINDNGRTVGTISAADLEDIGGRRQVASGLWGAPLLLPST